MRNQKIGLALQGGGSYAAFTAGVLKSLFSKKNEQFNKESIHSISGTSGGALNALLLGLAIHEGKSDASYYVKKFWKYNKLETQIKGKLKVLKSLPDNYLEKLIGIGRKFTDKLQPISKSFDTTGISSSMALDALDEIVHLAAPSLPQERDVELLSDKSPFVTVAATEAKSGKAHYFTNNEKMINKYRQLKISKSHEVMNNLTLNSVYASTSHPAVFKPMSIGEYCYWDGYYTSNPPFMYLFREGCKEVILVRLVKLGREEMRTDKKSIDDRIEEIIQNTAINMEINSYFFIREILYNNVGIRKANIELSDTKFTLNHRFHEIRLLKAGDIDDEGYPLAAFVDKLVKLGEKVVESKNGFLNSYAKLNKREHLVSEIDFPTGKVNTRIIDYDKLLFDEVSE